MIPANIEEVDAAWLGDVLDAPIRAMHVNQIGQGIGIMGDIYRVGIDYESEQSQAPSSVVVKLPSSFEENRAQGVALGMFEAEVRFYRDLAAQISVGLPRVFLADIEPGSAEFVIVMEDLSHLQMVDQSEGMSPSQAQAAVGVLAHVHAAWWDRGKDESLEWIPSMVGPRIEFVDQLLTEIHPVFVEGFASYLPEGGLEIYELFAGNYLKINSVLAGRSPWTVVHQDYRVENLLFGPEGSGEVVVLDWQGIGRGPGAYDLAYILSGSMTPQLRRAHERDLVGAYYDQLTPLGVSGYSRDQLWDDYGHAQLMGGLATSMVTGGGMDLSNERGLNLIATMAARHVTAALDHDGLARLKEIV